MYESVTPLPPSGAHSTRGNTVELKGNGTYVTMLGNAKIVDAQVHVTARTLSSFALETQPRETTFVLRRADYYVSVRFDDVKGVGSLRSRFALPVDAAVCIVALVALGTTGLIVVYAASDDVAGFVAATMLSVAAWVTTVMLIRHPGRG